jgi:hypothetical protein
MRWALACLLVGCYHVSNTLDCVVSCASDGKCPNGLQCGVSDQLCHAGLRECSEIDASVPDTAAPPAAFCDRSQDTIIACYEFEGTTASSSKYALSTTTSSVTFQSGMTGLGQALVLTSGSTVQIGETTDLDLQSFTVEAWLDQTSATNNHNVTVVNNVLQYGMFVDVDNAPYCAYFASKLFVAVGPTPLTVNQWTHVACTYDGTQLTLYVDGTAVADIAQGGSVVTTNKQGTGIGSDMINTAPEAHYVGLIDDLRILSVPRTHADICADAGRTACP